MKDNLVLSFFIICLFVVPFASADLIVPGIIGLSIENKITNINEFPNYMFVSYGAPMCRLTVLGETGIIPLDYKFCSLSIYAIKKTDFNESYLRSLDKKELLAYLDSDEAEKVISGIGTYKEIAITSNIKSITNYYSIELDKIKTFPDKTEIRKNIFFYLYVIIPTVTLIVIILLLKKRRKK